MCKAVHVFDCVSCAPVESELTIGFLIDDKDIIPRLQDCPYQGLLSRDTRW
jgi:hypothetical protein